MHKVFCRYWVLALVMLVGQSLAAEKDLLSYGSKKDGVRHVNAAEAAQILKLYPSVQVLDVRTGFEYGRGHLRDSTNINYY